MKNFKKISAAIAATLMAATLTAPMAITSSAVDVTINNVVGDVSVHEYSAYQIFKADITTDGVLSNIEWGDNIAQERTVTSGEGEDATNTVYKLVDEIQAIKVGETTPFAGKTTASDIAEVLGGTEENPTGFDAEITKKFASVVGNYLTGTAKATWAGTASGTISAKGYYLVEDSKAPEMGEGGLNSGAKTRFILQVANEENINVEAKSSAPTVMKKVQEEDLIGGAAETAEFAGSKEYALGDGYNDVADYDIGDDVPFKLYGTMPDTLGDYSAYFYQFIDTLGNEFDAPESVTIKVDDTEITPGDGNCSFEKETKDGKTEIKITFKDIKEYGVTEDSVVTVEYTAKLNKNAKIGLPGQLNAVELEYSNNPNLNYNPDESPEGPEEKGKTPKDGVIVFTYGIDLNKVDGNGDKLANAVFAIKDSEGNYLKADANGKYDGTLAAKPAPNEDGTWTNNPAAGIFVSTTGALIEIAGLDDGVYTIEELAAPSGYNKLDGDIRVTVTSKHKEGQETGKEGVQDWIYGETEEAAAPALVEIKFQKGAEGSEVDFAEDINGEAEAEGTVQDGKGVLTIENKKGSLLPSTGGIGTTLFYVGGGAMVAVAGVFLITKKRMGRRED